MSRLTSGFWVQAYLQRLQLEGIAVYIRATGDATAGAVAVKLATLDGRARAHQRGLDPMTGQRQWMLLGEGAEAEIDAMLDRQRARDPDLWIVEVEDRAGRDLLDQPGLAE